MRITSVQNETIKRYALLKNKKNRDEAKEFIVEGYHLVKEALKTNLVKKIFYADLKDIDAEGIECIEVSENVLAKLSFTSSPQGIVAVVSFFDNEINIHNYHKAVALDRIQDPGNLGTIIRSSKAFGIDTVVLGEGCVDLYNDKVIRSTQGIGFHMNIVSRNLSELITELKEKEIPVLGTKVEFGEDIRNLTSRDKEKFALIMGNEGRGVNPEILALCDKYIYIELNSDVESLNVAIAASILLYELSRRD